MSSDESKAYIPGVADVLTVRDLLATRVPRKLPVELIDMVIDHAEYWPRVTASINRRVEAVGRRIEHIFVLRTPPLCTGAADPGGRWEGEERGRESENVPAPGQHAASLPECRFHQPARRIVWTLRSHDQGWSSERGTTYQNSWTGFDGAVERYHPAEPDPTSSAENAAAADVAAAGAAAAAPALGLAHSHDTPSSASLPFDARPSDEYLRTWEADAPAQWEQPKERRPVLHNAYYAEPFPAVWPRREWHNGPMHVQVNARANRQVTEHVVRWDWRDNITPGTEEAQQKLSSVGRGQNTGDGGLVRALRRGDSVVLWAFAFFPSWSNSVESASVSVEFAL